MLLASSTASHRRARRPASAARRCLVEAEEKAIESDSDDARVEACFGGRDLVKLYVKEKELLFKTDLIAKQKWWARCNATEPKTKKKRKEPEEPGAFLPPLLRQPRVSHLRYCARIPRPGSRRGVRPRRVAVRICSSR